MLSNLNILALNLCSGLTSSMLKNIVETGVSIEEILTATTKDLSEIGLKSSSIKSIHKFNYFLDLANIQFEIAQKNNYKIINFWDEDYPFY